MNDLLKKILIGIVLLVLIILTILFGNSKNNYRFYLEDKYYNSGDAINVDSKYLEEIDKESFLLFTYNYSCGMTRPCEEVFDKVLKDIKVDYYTISIDEFKKTKYHEIVKYAPSFIIIKNGEIVTYLDAENDNHLDYYQEESSFKNWLNQYIQFTKKISK